MNPFAELGLEERFDLDAEAVESAYLGLAASAHPDRFTDPIEQAEAAEKASVLNEARDVLLDPERRARALLDLFAPDAKVDDKALPDAFLMDMMDVRERLEQAVASNDPEQLAAMRTWADKARAQHLGAVARHFEQGAGRAQAIRMELNALRYIERMIEQMPTA
ncbi:iron-sulfur cluster co-chaperone HscB C-terminal domain-containing protein [Mucisphaera calidilacus]|uniref:J domain-containing protein n=1 Tax=Mucisphaera calidilacus TaxID=2527982 RepID=A0A518BVJ7_9BACT|nr:iron-sulfur cluster co-chaperone HscB C-terminal domain-containing protein [Mucisphaera calidilacus]QDU70999.1 hypothetical protein Pan265_08440 [Mucisphaera calidilacus]